MSGRNSPSSRALTRWRTAGVVLRSLRKKTKNAPRSRARMRTMTGARLTRKSVKLRSAALPMRMLGGSPMSVAVPPMLEAMTCETRNGTGFSSIPLATNRERGRDPFALPRRLVEGADGKPLERSCLTGDAGYHHHPHQQEDDVEVNCGERLLLIDDSEQNHSDAAREGGGRPVYTLGDDHQVGEPEDQACYRQFGPPSTPCSAPSWPGYASLLPCLLSHSRSSCRRSR